MMDSHSINLNGVGDGSSDTQQHAPLAAYHWHAQGAPTAMVLIVHGMAEHARRYAAFAEQLNAARLDVHAFDLRGHGATTPPIDHGHIGTTTTWQTLVDDVEAVRQRAIELSGPLPIILFGHSLGSFIAQSCVQTQGRDYSAVVLSGPANPGRAGCRLGAAVAAAEAKRTGAAGRSALIRALTFGAYERALKKRLHTQRTRFDWLSSRDDAVDAYINDRLAGFDMRTLTWQRLLSGMARSQSPHARRKAPADLPLLIAAGQDDPVGQFGQAPQTLANAYNNNGQADVTVRLYADNRHELINDIAADEFVRDLLDWLAERTYLRHIR